MDTIRQQKIARLIQKELCEFFRMHQRNFFFNRMISVTVVRISPDLSMANIYVSIYPSKDSKEDIEIIRKKKKTIRYWLGKRVSKQLRVIPDLLFYIDDSLDYAENIEKLLN